MSVQSANSVANGHMQITSSLLDYRQPYTFMFWARLVTDLNTWTGLWGISQTTDFGDYDEVQTSTDGLIMKPEISVDGTTDSGTGDLSMTVGTWFHIALVMNGTTFKMYNSGVEFNSTTMPGDETARSAATNMMLGGNSRWEDTSVISFFACKAWEAALSAAEIANEARIVVPSRFANLYGFWPLWNTGDAKDYFGGHHWTVGSSCTSSDNPPIPYCAIPDNRIYIPAVVGGSRRIFLIS